MRTLGVLLLALFASFGASAAHAARLTIDVRGAPLVDVLAMLAAQSGKNIVADPTVKTQTVTLRLQGVSIEGALDTLASAYDLSLRTHNGVTIVGDGHAAQTIVLTLSRANPDDVAKELSAGMPAGSIAVADKRTQSVIVTGDGATVEFARRIAGALDRRRYSGDDRNLAHVYTLRFVKASDAAAELKAVLSDGSYVADEPQNAIVVSGNDDVQNTAEHFLKSIDVAAPQVLFEVRVADLQPVNESSNVGVQLGGYDLGGQPMSGAATYAFTRNSLALNATLNALVSRGSARILATPKLVTLNNKEADLLIGQTYPVVYYDARLGGQQVQFVDIGVKLRLTATIGADGSVTAEMHPEYSAIQDFVAGYPVIASRRVDSTLRVKNDQTIVLGGLLRDIDTQTLSKVPGVSDIPVIGELFQNRQRTRERDEIVFLITPHVLFPNAPVPDR